MILPLSWSVAISCLYHFGRKFPLRGSLGQIQDYLKIPYLQYEILGCLFWGCLEMFLRETFGNNNQLLEIKRVNIASPLIFFEKLLQSSAVMKILLYCIWGTLI